MGYSVFACLLGGSTKLETFDLSELLEPLKKLVSTWTLAHNLTMPMKPSGHSQNQSKVGTSQHDKTYDSA
jgi:hypothetical protein